VLKVGWWLYDQSMYLKFYFIYMRTFNEIRSNKKMVVDGVLLYDASAKIMHYIYSCSLEKGRCSIHGNFVIFILISFIGV